MGNTSSTKTVPVPSPMIPLTLVGDLTTVSMRTLRRRSMSNLLRMGHCAPTVMQTLLDASDTEAEWLVKLTAGLTGGIGNTGAECGGVTAPSRRSSTVLTQSCSRCVMKPVSRDVRRDVVIRCFIQC